MPNYNITWRAENVWVWLFPVVSSTRHVRPLLSQLRTRADFTEIRAQLIDPTIANYRGRIVKLMGDGALVEFASVVDAVECAVSIQRDMVEHTADTTDSKRITSGELLN